MKRRGNISFYYLVLIISATTVFLGISGTAIGADLIRLDWFGGPNADCDERFGADVALGDLNGDDFG